MNFKIIRTKEGLPDVLLTRDRDENSQEIVQIVAFGTIEDIDDCIAYEFISFENKETACLFISDFSELSAEKWCEKEGITY